MTPAARQQVRCNREVDLFLGLQVDQYFKFGGLLDRPIRGLAPFHRFESHTLDRCLIGVASSHPTTSATPEFCKRSSHAPRSQALSDLASLSCHRQAREVAAPPSSSTSSLLASHCGCSLADQLISRACLMNRPVRDRFSARDFCGSRLTNVQSILIV